MQLFERSVDGVTPTDAALLLLPAAERMEQAAFSMLTSLNGLDPQVSGSVRVAADEAVANYLLLPKVHLLRASFPKLTLELSPSTELVNMSRNEADLALRFERPARGDLIVKRVGVVTMGLFAAADSPWARLPPDECAWVHWTSAFQHMPDAAWVQRHYPNRPSAVRTTNLVSIITAVSRGLGIGLVPHALAAELGGLVEVEQPYPVLELPLWLAGHRAHKDVARVRVVRSFIEEACLALQDAAD